MPHVFHEIESFGSISIYYFNELFQENLFNQVFALVIKILIKFEFF